MNLFICALLFTVLSVVKIAKGGTVTFTLIITPPPGTKLESGEMATPVRVYARFEIGGPSDRYKGATPLGEYAGKWGSGIPFTTLVKEFKFKLEQTAGWTIEYVESSAIFIAGDNHYSLDKFRVIPKAYPEKRDWANIATINGTRSREPFDVAELPPGEKSGPLYCRYVLFFYDPPQLK